MILTRRKGGLFAVGLVALAVLGWHWLHRPIVRVVNLSAVALEDVVVLTTGHGSVVGTVPPGETRTTTIDWTGTSDIVVAFQDGRQRRTMAADQYLEPSTRYSGEVTFEFHEGGDIRVTGALRASAIPRWNR